MKLTGKLEIPENEIQKLLSLLRPINLFKGDFYIREGQIPKKFGFVEKGLFRYLYIDQKGNEYTKNFMPEGNFIASYSAMILQQPSKMYIEALEDSTIYTINYNDWLILKQDDRCWDNFLITMLEKAFIIKETRERELLLMEANERYAIFKSEYPGLEKRIKQNLLASYLGISPISLSRIRHNNRELT